MISYPSRLVLPIIVFLFVMAIGLPQAVWANGAPTTQITIHNFAFNPSDVTVTVGTTLMWTNNDTTVHTTTSDTGSRMSWDSGPISPGQSYLETFSSVGNFSYHCSIHPSMHGIIHVVASGTQAAVTAPMSMTSEANEYSSSSPQPTTRVYSTTRQLPKTGPPLAGLALIGLLPLGLKLRHYGKRI